VLRYEEQTAMLSAGLIFGRILTDDDAIDDDGDQLSPQVRLG